MSLFSKGAEGEQALTIGEWKERTRNMQTPLTDSTYWRYTLGAYLDANTVRHHTTKGES